MNIRAWLRKSPQPSRLRVDGRDVAIIEGKWKWAEAERAISGMDGNKIEALDTGGAVLRACMLDDGEADESKASNAKESELVLVARELRIAADESAGRHADAYKYAFETVASMFNAQSSRLASLETAWQKLVLAGASGDGENEGLLAQFLSGALQGKADAAPNGKKK